MWNIIFFSDIPFRNNYTKPDGFLIEPHTYTLVCNKTYRYIIYIQSKNYKCDAYFCSYITCISKISALSSTHTSEALLLWQSVVLSSAFVCGACRISLLGFSRRCAYQFRSFFIVYIPRPTSYNITLFMYIYLYIQSVYCN